MSLENDTKKIVDTLIVREKLLIKARNICKEENLDYSSFLDSERFKSMATNKIYSHLKAKYYKPLNKHPQPLTEIYERPKGIAVDASTTGGNPGICECRGIDLQTGKIVFSEQIGMATNNIAEFLAIAYGANYIAENKLNCTLWSDSKICINWYYKKECKTNIFEKYPDKCAQNPKLAQIITEGLEMVKANDVTVKFWNKYNKGENPADYGRK